MACFDRMVEKFFGPSGTRISNNNEAVLMYPTPTRKPVKTTGLARLLLVKLPQTGQALVEEARQKRLERDDSELMVLHDEMILKLRAS